MGRKEKEAKRKAARTPSHSSINLAALGKTALVIALVAISVTAVYNLWPEGDPIPPFHAWLEANGVTTECEILELSGTGRGLVAKKYLEEGDVAASIPLDLVVRMSAVMEEKFVPRFESLPGNNPLEPFILWLLHEKGRSSSFYKPYLDILPKSYSSHPLNWTPDELDTAIGTGLDSWVRNTHTLLKNSFDSLKAKGFLSRRTYDEFVWGYITAGSRTIKVPPTRSGERQELALVPYLDLFNHDPAGMGFEVDSDLTELRAVTGTSYAAGEQVFVNYGCKSNYALASEYGFILEDNICDSVNMKVGLPLNPLLKGVVDEVPPGSDPTKRFYNAKADTFPSELVTAFRLNYATASDVPRASRALEGEALSLENERMAIRAAVQGMESVLETYISTPAQDEELLAREDLSANQRMGIMLGKMSKAILKNAIALTQQRHESALIKRSLPGGLTF